ncbi:MAG: hypothetical protein ACEPO8_04620 [Rhodothermaceae bacterium]
MEKIKLNLEELKVDSFNVISDDAKDQGTILGNRPTPYSGCGDMTCGNTGCGECGTADCVSNYCTNGCPTQYTCRTCLEDTCTTDVPHHCTGEKTMNYDCM